MSNKFQLFSRSVLKLVDMFEEIGFSAKNMGNENYIYFKYLENYTISSEEIGTINTYYLRDFPKTNIFIFFSKKNSNLRIVFDLIIEKLISGEHNLEKIINHYQTVYIIVYKILKTLNISEENTFSFTDGDIVARPGYELKLIKPWYSNANISDLDSVLDIFYKDTKCSIKICGTEFNEEEYISIIESLKQASYL